MKQRKPSRPPANDIGEIPALIDTLYRTDRRLEQLTAGEVDAVTSDDGRILLLGRAQDHLRHNEAAKQLAILNALPAHIALLDVRGRIVSVNEGWRRFADANLPQYPDSGVGVDYLAICDEAQGDDAPRMRRVAAGIRVVLSGEAPAFSIEYTCHAPDQRHWFLLTVTPLKADGPGGVVVMDMDITMQRQAEQSLLDSEQRFSDLLRNVELASVMLDGDAQITFCNQYMLQLTGWRLDEVLGHNWFEVFVPSRHRTEQDFFDRHLANGSDAWQCENEILTRAGATRLMRWSNLVLRSAAGDVVGTASIGQDITEQRQIEIDIRRLNRMHAVMSGINGLIVRVRERDELFREACRVAVEAGGFRMAWIGMVDPVTMRIVPSGSAASGDGHLMELCQRRLQGGTQPLGDSLPAQAIREKRVVVIDNLQDDPGTVVDKAYAESGIHSIAAFPITVADHAVGVLTLYAGDADFFHAEELRLLSNLAGEIAFAVDYIEKGEKLNYLAYYDAITGLANHSLFLERVAQYTRAGAGGDQQLAVFLIDLERFKNINDSLGQSIGDALLRQVAEWLTRNAGAAHLLARIGADHFAAVLPVVNRHGDVARLVEKMMEAFVAHPFRLGGTACRIGAKVGIAVFPRDGVDAGELFRNAEAALKRAKAAGEPYLFYDRQMSELGAVALTLENQLRHALEAGEFELYYQPKISLASGRLTGAEALIRWNDPRLGLVPPADFIPSLEETGLIHEVGRWALRQAAGDYLRWRRAGLAVVPLAVNVSPLQLRRRSFLADIEQVIGLDDGVAAGLELEITESVIMENVAHSIDSLRAIRALGIGIAIDDFGTGFSSLNYLSRLPVDTLKIDRSFVTAMTAGAQDLALVSTIINLGKSLKLKVVAEGVETAEQEQLLRSLGCDEMQGFLISRELPPAVFEARYLGGPPSQ